MLTAKELKKTKEIEEGEEELMAELLEAKFTNDNKLNTFLLDTGIDTMLYEATLHWKWGCGGHLGQIKII